MFLVGGFLFVNVNINIRDLLAFLPEGYSDAWHVVLILSIAALYNMATGLNAPILFNSDKYKYGAFFLISLAVVVVVLQNVLIPLFGLNGAALATALASFFYNTMLFVYVKKQFNLMPFGKGNLRVLMLVIILTTIGFLLPSLENKVWSIAYKSIIVSSLYIITVYKMSIAPELHQFIPAKFRR